MAALEAEKAAAREKAAAEAKAIEDEKERQRVVIERGLRAKRRAERMEKQVAAEAERQRLAEEAAAAATTTAKTATTTTTEEAPTGTTTTTKDDDGTSSTGGDKQTPAPSPSANNAVGAIGSVVTDPSTAVTAPTAPAVTVAVQPAETQPDPEEEEPAAPPSKIAEVVVAYSHSRIVLPTGRNDASWWEKIFFDVSHIGCDHCNAFPMEVFFKCLHCNDVYLCENCESHHPRTHLMAKVSTPFRWTQPNLRLHPSHSIHAGICSVCAGPFGEVQYQCSECESYKICSTCRKAGPLDHEHSKFWEVVVPENDLHPPGRRGNNPRGASCDGKGSKCMGSCKGINWKCLVCNDYDLCEACEKNREFSCRSYYGNRNTHDMTHPLLKVLDSRFQSGTKWMLSCPVYRF
ncbi:hypothetical protein Pelo_8729 [Pelomyxa schiedti]|nr:hypothetical protein Pelo_8729 [Pelomyxa schiedti]